MNAWTDEWDPAAESEYVQAFVYYESIDRKLADRLAKEVDHSVEIILRNRAVAAPHLADTRRKLLDRFPYAIVYRPIESRRVIYVSAFVHFRREPGYWIER